MYQREIKTTKNFNDMTFRAFMAENGYNVQTTFWEDFSAADIFGLSAIQDTFNPLKSGKATASTLRNWCWY